MAAQKESKSNSPRLRISNWKSLGNEIKCARDSIHYLPSHITLIGPIHVVDSNYHDQPSFILWSCSSVRREHIISVTF